MNNDFSDSILDLLGSILNIPQDPNITRNNTRGNPRGNQSSTCPGSFENRHTSSERPASQGNERSGCSRHNEGDFRDMRHSHGNRQRPSPFSHGHHHRFHTRHGHRDHVVPGPYTRRGSCRSPSSSPHRQSSNSDNTPLTQLREKTTEQLINERKELYKRIEDITTEIARREFASSNTTTPVTEKPASSDSDHSESTSESLVQENLNRTAANLIKTVLNNSINNQVGSDEPSVSESSQPKSESDNTTESKESTPKPSSDSQNENTKTPSTPLPFGVFIDGSRNAKILPQSSQDAKEYLGPLLGLLGNLAGVNLSDIINKSDDTLEKVPKEDSSKEKDEGSQVKSTERRESEFTNAINAAFSSGKANAPKSTVQDTPMSSSISTPYTNDFDIVSLDEFAEELGGLIDDDDVPTSSNSNKQPPQKKENGQPASSSSSSNNESTTSTTSQDLAEDTEMEIDEDDNANTQPESFVTPGETPSPKINDGLQLRLDTIQNKLEDKVSRFNKLQIAIQTVESPQKEFSFENAEKELSTLEEKRAAVNFHIRELQHLQNAFESIYSELDIMIIDGNDDRTLKRKKHELTGKAVTYSDKIDSAIFPLKDLALGLDLRIKYLGKRVS